VICRFLQSIREASLGGLEIKHAERRPMNTLKQLLIGILGVMPACGRQAVTLWKGYREDLQTPG